MSDGYSENEVDIRRERDRSRRSVRRRLRDDGSQYDSQDDTEDLYGDDRDDHGSRRHQSRPRTRPQPQFHPALPPIVSGGNSVATDASYEHRSNDSSKRRTTNVDTQRRPSHYDQTRPNLNGRQPVPQQNTPIAGESVRPGGLTRLASGFVDIKYDNIAGCSLFAREQPDIFDEDTDKILEAAKSAFSTRDRDVNLGDRCVQRASIIKFFRNYPTDTRYKYIRLLSDRETKIHQQFWNYFNEVRASTIAEASRRASQNPQAVNILPAGVGGTARGPYTPGSFPPTETVASLSIRETRSDDRPANQVRQINEPLAQHPRRPSVSGQQPSGYNAGKQRDPAKGSRTLTEDAKSTAGTYLESYVPTPTTLNKNYFIRKDPKEFFRIGRLFKVLWHTNVGSDILGNKNLAVSTIGKFGEPIYSALRWMLVVRSYSGHCICCPISTYGGLGLSKKRFREADIEAHACVYDDSTTAMVFSDEKLTKKAMPVRVANGKIHAASRVHFGKFHTVEYNTKVLEIGMVRADYLHNLTRYVNEEMEKGQI